jgi:hypothetical protein
MAGRSKQESHKLNCDGLIYLQPRSPSYARAVPVPLAREIRCSQHSHTHFHIDHGITSSNVRSSNIVLGLRLRTSCAVCTNSYSSRYRTPLGLFRVSVDIVQTSSHHTHGNEKTQPYHGQTGQTDSRNRKLEEIEMTKYARISILYVKVVMEIMMQGTNRRHVEKHSV